MCQPPAAGDLEIHGTLRHDFWTPLDGWARALLFPADTQSRRACAWSDMSG
jgi:hypothetical protein